MLLVYALQCVADAENVHIQVDVSASKDGVIPQQGFLHGFSAVNYQAESLNMALLQPLQPSFWRIGLSNNFEQNYQLAKTLNPNVKTTLVLSDLLAARYGGYSKLRPWRNWARYEQDIRAIVQSLHSKGYQIDYWDIWSEPDVKGFWSGNCNHAMEMLKRTHQVIRAEIPNAKITGPSISAFESKGMCKQPFLAQWVEYAALHKLKLDAISWHEFGQPQDVSPHVAIVRKHFQEHPALGVPEIHINEYSGPAGHAVPGLAVHWLQALESASVDWSSRACWDKQCESGLDGLFHADNQTPNPVYWVYRAYVEMSSHRLGAQTDSGRVAAIAGLNNAKKKLTLLVGVDARQQVIHQLNISVDDYPYSKSNVQIVAKRITSQTPENGETFSPVVNHRLEGGKLNFTLDNVFAGDAYWIEIADTQSQ